MSWLLHATAYLRRRFIDELPLWRLSAGQLCFLLLWSAWPFLARWAFPGNDVAMLPVLIFYPFVYVLGYPLVLILVPGVSAEVGGSLAIAATVFPLAYLGLVSWRQAQLRTRRAKIITKVLELIVLLVLVAFLVFLWS